MKKSNCEKNDYLAPVVKSVSFKIERGFELSANGGTESGLSRQLLFNTESLEHGGENDNFNGYFFNN